MRRKIVVLLLSFSLLGQLMSSALAAAAPTMADMGMVISAEVQTNLNIDAQAHDADRAVSAHNAAQQMVADHCLMMPGVVANDANVDQNNHHKVAGDHGAVKKICHYCQFHCTGALLTSWSDFAVDRVAPAAPASCVSHYYPNVYFSLFKPPRFI